MKHTKTDPRLILIGKQVAVNQLYKESRFSLRFRIERLEGNMFEGTVFEASENSPYPVGSSYSVSENEIKYHSVLS